MRSIYLLAILLVLGAMLMPVSSGYATESTILYYNSGSRTTAGVTAYDLNTERSGTYYFPRADLAAEYNVTFGYRLYLVNSATSRIELTTDVVGQTLLSATLPDWAAYNKTWNCPGVNVVLGYQALEAELWYKLNSGAWVLMTSYISPLLMTSHLEEATWTLSTLVHFTKGGGITELIFINGDLATPFPYTPFNDNNFISNVVIKTPSNYDIGFFKQSHGDIVGFILGAYINQIGVGFYLLVLLMLTGALWLNYKHIGPVLFVFVIFGGSGGLIWVFVPPVGAAVIDVLLLLGFAALLYKVTRN